MTSIKQQERETAERSKRGKAIKTKTEMKGDRSKKVVRKMKEENKERRRKKEKIERKKETSEQCRSSKNEDNDSIKQQEYRKGKRYRQ